MKEFSVKQDNIITICSIIWFVVLSLIGCIPARILNIYVYPESGSVFLLLWWYVWVFYIKTPKFIIDIIIKIAKIK